MRRISLLCMLFVLLVTLPAVSLAATRALLVACSDFITQPDLGSTVSGNLHMIGSALLGVSPRLEELSIEDGTIGTPQALGAAIASAFEDAVDGDLSLLYLCTHGISSSDDNQVYLLLGDGNTESLLTAAQLCDMLSQIPGEKLLILDACFSGALIGRSAPLPMPATPGELPPPDAIQASPFLGIPGIHVLTSASSHESSWYYDSRHLSTGAVSYFASAIASGLGLYGAAEADLDADGMIALDELHRYLCMAVPSSGSQLLSASVESISLPAVQRPLLTRPLSGFSYGESLLSADEPVFDFSFTVTQETTVQYRLIDYEDGRWNWENAKTFLDVGENGDHQLSPGRKSRTLILDDLTKEESGYLMLQVYSLSGDAFILCSERLIAVQPASSGAQLSLFCHETYENPAQEYAIGVHLSIPAEISVSILNDQGTVVRRLCRSQLTRPAPGDLTQIYWDGRDAGGTPLPDGVYTIQADAYICGARQRASAHVALFGIQPR